MNVYVVIGGRVDWNNEGGDEFDPSVIGVYTSKEVAEIEAHMWVAKSIAADDLLDDEFWYDISEKIVK